MTTASVAASPPTPNPSSVRRRRIAFVGTGGRACTFLDPVAGLFSAEAEIVGLCDRSMARAAFHRQRLHAQFQYPAVPVYPHTEFHRMLGETKPDSVVVCTIDREHEPYIVAALRGGCDVITEKPMTISAEACASILRAVAETGRSVRVAFNYRWSVRATMVREILAAGRIGQVHHVTMEYLLNTSHGADYFRRWHARKENSGGLLVHKATHHFDLVNWWIDAIPEHVFAHGALAFYGRSNAVRRGDEALTRYPRYLGSKVNGDPFAYDYGRPVLQDAELERGLYLGAAEEETGYVRDQNVFRDDIDIEDTMAVIVRYRTGALLNYSLNAFSPYEGYRVAFAGDRGRIEYDEFHGAHLPNQKLAVPEHARAPDARLRVYPHFEESYEIPLPSSQGAHGGSDALLQRELFSSAPPEDLLRRAAGHEQGAASILVGVAANLSLASGQPQAISRLVSLQPRARRLSELI